MNLEQMLLPRLRVTTIQSERQFQQLIDYKSIAAGYGTLQYTLRDPKWIDVRRNLSVVGNTMLDATAFAYINDTAGKHSLTLQPHSYDICLSKIITGLVVIQARADAPERRAGPGDLMLFQNAPGTQVESSDQCVRMSVFLQSERLAAQLERLFGRKLTAKLCFAPPDRWSQRAAGSIARAIDFVAAELADPASLFATGVGVAHFEEMLGLQLLHGAPHNYAEAIRQRRTQRPATGTKRAEAFMRDNLNRRISVADIAAAASCSTRSILNAFRSDHDRTVVSFLRDLRLDAAPRPAGRHAYSNRFSPAAWLQQSQPLLRPLPRALRREAG